MTVNHVVEGSSPSVPVLVLIQQNEDVSLVQVQSFLKWNLYFENCKKQRYAATAMT